MKIITTILILLTCIGCGEKQESHFVAGKCDGCNFKVGRVIDRISDTVQMRRIYVISADDYYTLIRFSEDYQNAIKYNPNLKPNEIIGYQMGVDRFIRGLYKRSYEFSKQIPIYELPLSDSLYYAK